MLEITPDDIALLNDTELRTLIGLLCEAELRKRGLSAAAATWGGHQNSADGGLDVRVALGDGHPDPKLADFAKSEKSRLSQAIAEARKVRPPIYMERDEGSFE
jgi:hypothetical protein